MGCANTVADTPSARAGRRPEEGSSGSVLPPSPLSATACEPGTNAAREPPRRMSQTDARDFRAPGGDRTSAPLKTALLVFIAHEHPAANLFRKQVKSSTFSTGGVVLPSQLA